MKNKGFTLIELIVVIAIIAVLAVVLAPQYIQYVERSRESSDLQRATTLIEAVQLASIEAVLAGEIPPGTIIQAGWPNNKNQYVPGLIYVGEATTTGNEATTSVVIPAGYTNKGTQIFANLRDRVCLIMGGEIHNYNYANYKYCDIGTPLSTFANENGFTFHLNTATGEIGLANGVNSSTTSDDWVDHMGLSIQKAP